MEQGREVRDDDRIVILVKPSGELLASLEESMDDHRSSPRRKYPDRVKHGRLADAVPAREECDAPQSWNRQPANPPKPFDVEAREAQEITLRVGGHGRR